MASIASIEEEISQYSQQLDTIEAGLKDDPENTELVTLRDELHQMLSLLRESLLELMPAQAPPPDSSQPFNPDQNKPAAVQSAGGPDHPDALLSNANSVVYKLNDSVVARWSVDKAWYPARLTSITGSSTAPIYVVKFKIDDTIDTVRAKDIRPAYSPPTAASTGPSGTAINAATDGMGKRKADSGATYGLPETLATSLADGHSAKTTIISSPGVISAAASLYPEAKVADIGLDSAKGPKTKKIKARKDLEEGKSKWQDFSTKSRFSKSGKKDSMFRTPDGIHGRVGFTGSGQAMRKDPTRARHIYQPTDEAE